MAEGFPNRSGVRDWVAAQYRLKVRLAQQCGKKGRLALVCTGFKFVAAWWARQQGHPGKRWSDDLEHSWLSAHGV